MKQESVSDEITDDVPKNVHLILIVVISVIAIVLQYFLFGIGWGLEATFAVLLTFLLAIVAARVSGETVLRLWVLWQVTQLTFGVIESGNVSANLMAANVTGGAASQCADLLHDMKTGLLIGASPRQQTYGQLAGVIAGAVFGCLGYLVLGGRCSQSPKTLGRSRMGHARRGAMEGSGRTISRWPRNLPQRGNCRDDLGRSLWCRGCSAVCTSKSGLRGYLVQRQLASHLYLPFTLSQWH